jgi:predicted metal-dependent phosphoesterase TrpH
VPRYDLHCHSTHSDGLLTPSAVVARAAARGVDVLALTDHDEVSGLAEAKSAAADAGIRVVCGSELSVTWEDGTLHVVGLQIDPDNSVLTRGLETVRAGRSTRARKIGESLAAAGIDGAYEGAMKYVTSERLVSRTHFARYLVEAGHARETNDVFKRYLSPGKPGYVPHAWATLSQAVDQIHAAGGQAVLAHPGRYKLTRTGMRRLLAEFRDIGGDAIEVLTSSHTPAQYTEFATYARVFALRASGRLGLAWSRRKLDGLRRLARAAARRRSGLEGLVACRAAAPSSSFRTARASLRKCSATACCRNSRASNSSG